MFLTKHTNELLEAMHLASTRVEEKKKQLYKLAVISLNIWCKKKDS